MRSRKYTEYVIGKLRSTLADIQTIQEDGGADLLGTAKNGKRVCVKCEYCQNGYDAVGEDVLLRLCAAKEQHGCDLAMLVTNGVLDELDDSRAFAEEHRILVKESVKMPQTSAAPIEMPEPLPPKKQKKTHGCLIPAFVVLTAVVLFIVIIFVIAGLAEEDDAGDNSAGESVGQTDVITENEPETEEEGAKATTGEKNALRRAKSYLQTSSFSRDGLVNQLEWEGFTTSEAEYGADNVGADWNEQAIKRAKSYLDSSSFSYVGLVRQLEYEKFTTEQAEYGADNCGADWNEQAVKKAESYLSSMAFSKEGLISQLEFEGFTHEQAVYGAEQNGY